jgi:hypothetical protein
MEAALLLYIYSVDLQVEKFLLHNVFRLWIWCDTLCVVDVIEIHTLFFPTLLLLLLLLLQVQETGGRQLEQSQWDSPSRN